MSRPTHAACRAPSTPWDGSCVCHERRLIAAAYDHSASWAPASAVADPVTAISALTMGTASHIGDDLAYLMAQSHSHYLR
jgi:hypothetical protein